MTEVREITIMCEIKTIPILDEKLYLEKNNKYNDHNNQLNRMLNLMKEDKDFKEYLRHLDYQQIIAEYKYLRKSIEENRTYEEASELYISEMEFRRKYSKNYLERLALEIYKTISNYGEDLNKSIRYIFVALIFHVCHILYSIK